MDHFKNIYSNKADAYEAMVAVEDYEGNILRTLADIRPFSNLDIVELGAGTGRLTYLLAPHVKSIRAYDAAPAMLDVAAAKLEKTDLTNWQTSVADNRSVPVEDKTADMAIAGWSLAHSVAWYPDSWQSEIGQMIAEMERILRPGGTLILLETMGTGSESPQPPTEGLAALYSWWEKTYGFQARAIRTDYQFDSPEQGAHLTRFFFGDELADRILAEQLTILPECTGVWWKTV